MIFSSSEQDKRPNNVNGREKLSNVCHDAQTIISELVVATILLKEQGVGWDSYPSSYRRTRELLSEKPATSSFWWCESFNLNEKKFIELMF